MKRLLITRCATLEVSPSEALSQRATLTRSASRPTEAPLHSALVELSVVILGQK
jgi:hypothetical protein